MKTISTSVSITTTALITFLLLLAGCSSSNDANDFELEFEEITHSDIAAMSAQMTDGLITVTDEDGIQTPRGTIIVYSTRNGYYGKLLVQDVDAAENYDKTIDVVTFDEDGSELVNVSGLLIQGTWFADLENGREASVGDERDYFYFRDTETDSFLEPLSGAVFTVHSTP